MKCGVVVVLMEDRWLLVSFMCIIIIKNSFASHGIMLPCLSVTQFPLQRTPQFCWWEKQGEGGRGAGPRPSHLSVAGLTQTVKCMTCYCKKPLSHAHMYNSFLYILTSPPPKKKKKFIPLLSPCEYVVDTYFPMLLMVLHHLSCCHVFITNMQASNGKQEIQAAKA